MTAHPCWGEVLVQRASAATIRPQGSLIDGVIILLAGALLVTPGILTDAFGFLCLVPGFRTVVKKQLLRRLERAAREGRVEICVQTDDPWGPREEKDVRDIRSRPGLR